MKIGVFPGSFNPITLGHLDIIERALPLFDEVIIAIGINPNKTYAKSLEERIGFLDKVFKNEPKVRIDHYEKLTVDYCKKVGAKYLIRGLRNSIDFNFEQPIAQMNYLIGDGIETIFLVSQPQLTHISSSLVREIENGGGDVSSFLP